MDQTKRMANQINQVETALGGVVDRIHGIERMLSDLKKSRPVVYVDEDTALITSNEADIQFIRRNQEDELSSLQHEHIL